MAGEKGPAQYSYLLSGSLCTDAGSHLPRNHDIGRGPRTGALFNDALVKAVV